MHDKTGACGVRFESLYDDCFLERCFFAVGSNPAKGERPHAYFLFKSGIYIYICTSCGNPHKHLACDWPWGAITRHSGAQSTATSAQPCFAHSAFDGARSIESGEDKGSA